MKEKRIRSALPIYLCAGVWLLYSLIGPLYNGLHLLMCFALSLAVYLISGKIFPGRVIHVEVDPKTGDAEIDRQIKEGREALKKLREANDAIPSPVISDQLERMEDAGMKIFEAVEQNTRKAMQVRKFMNYYLPTSVKLLTQYRTLSETGGDGENIQHAMNGIESSLEMIATAFEKQLDNLYSAEALDITTDIQVLETMMAGEGLTGKDKIKLK